MLKIRLCSNILKAMKNRNSCFRHQHCLSNSNLMKVAILGGAGRTGTSLSLFLKQSVLIDELSLYDIKPLRRNELELNSIDTNCKVTSYPAGDTGLKYTLKDAKIVLITAGKNVYASSKIASQQENLRENANILRQLIPSIITYCPEALVAIATNPVNSLVPLAVELYKKVGISKHKQIFGLTSLDCMKANVFLANHLGIDPEYVTVPVLGGNCVESCVPVFSQAKPHTTLTNEDHEKLICLLKRSFGDHHKKCTDQMTLSLSMGYAVSRFCMSLCKALRDQPGVVEYAYVRTCSVPDVTYFSEPIELGPCGIKKHLGLPQLNEREFQMLKSSITALKKAIRSGEVSSKFDIQN